MNFVRSIKRVRKRNVAIAALLSFLISLPVYKVVRSAVHSIRPPHAQVSLPDELKSIYKAVEIAAPGKITLASWYVPSRNHKTIILLHGFAGSRMQVIGEAEILRKKGYGILLFDARAHGESNGRSSNLGPKEAADLRAAVDWLVARPGGKYESIGAYGYSMGAATLALEAADDKRIKAMVFASSPSSQVDVTLEGNGILYRIQQLLELSVLRAAGVQGSTVNYSEAFQKLEGRPILLIQGLEDKTVSLRQAQKIYSTAKEPKSFLLLPKSIHGEFLDGEDADLYARSLVAFFEKNL